MTYLSSVHDVQFPPSRHWFCAIATFVLWIASLSSSLFILSMTFDRVYSIIKPHKAASFNTVKKAKVTIVCILIISLIINIPYLFVVTTENCECIADLDRVEKKLFYWVSYLIQFVIPFISLLSMNSVIIHTLRNRSLPETAKTVVNIKGHGQSQGQGQNQGKGQNSKAKNRERQIFIILLLVAFSFFVLISPFYAFVLYSEFVDFMESPVAFAKFFLFYQVMHKMYYTNNAINFFLYVISGRKFRRDLVNLFKFNRGNSKETTSPQISDISSKVTSVDEVLQNKPNTVSTPWITMTEQHPILTVSWTVL